MTQNNKMKWLNYLEIFALFSLALTWMQGRRKVRSLVLKNYMARDVFYICRVYTQKNHVIRVHIQIVLRILLSTIGRDLWLPAHSVLEFGFVVDGTGNRHKRNGKSFTWLRYTINDHKCTVVCCCGAWTSDELPIVSSMCTVGSLGDLPAILLPRRPPDFSIFPWIFESNRDNWADFPAPKSRNSTNSSSSESKNHEFHLDCGERQQFWNEIHYNTIR